jgi:hypothetical protein
MRTSRPLARPLAALGVAAIAVLLGACARVEPGHGVYAEPKPAAAQTSGTESPVTDPAPTTAPDSDTVDTSAPAPSDSDSGSPEPSDSPDSSDAPSSGDTAAAAQVAEDFYHAFGAEDGATMCALMTDAVAAGLGSSGGGDCATVAKAKAAELSSAERDALTRLDVDESQVTVSGDSATVPAAAMTVDGRHSDEAGAIQLTRDSAGWKISGAQ